jgi:hypothetical protein
MFRAHLRKEIFKRGLETKRRGKYRVTTCTVQDQRFALRSSLGTQKKMMRVFRGIERDKALVGVGGPIDI